MQISDTTCMYSFNSELAENNFLLILKINNRNLSIYYGKKYGTVVNLKKKEVNLTLNLFRKEK